MTELNEDLDDDSPEVDEQKTNNSALPWLIGSVSTLAFILVASVIFLWLRSVADEILIGGPPPTLTGWEQSYQELTGFDDVSGLDGSGVVVCVVDSGIEMSHPDLRHLTLAGWFDVINGQNEPYDDEGHGTAMAGIIVAKNGLSGNAQGVDLLVAKAIDAERRASVERYKCSQERSLSTVARIRDAASSAGNYNAAVAAETRRGQIAGLYVDKKEILTGTIDSMSRDEVEKKLQELKENHQDWTYITEAKVSFLTMIK